MAWYDLSLPAAVMWGLQYESGITDSYPRLYWYISVISVYPAHICVDISQQYLFLDSDHSSTPGSWGDQADCPDPNIIAEEALLTQQSHLQDTQARLG